MKNRISRLKHVRQHLYIYIHILFLCSTHVYRRSYSLYEYTLIYWKKSNATQLPKTAFLIEKFFSFLFIFCTFSLTVIIFIRMYAYFCIRFIHKTSCSIFSPFQSNLIPSNLIHSNPIQSNPFQSNPLLFILIHLNFL